MIGWPHSEGSSIKPRPTGEIQRPTVDIGLKTGRPRSSPSTPEVEKERARDRERKRRERSNRTTERSAAKST